MSNIAIQLEAANTLSHKLGNTVIGFIPEPGLPGIEGAVINSAQWEQLKDSIQAVPHKIDRTGTGNEYESVNGASW